MESTDRVRQYIEFHAVQLLDPPIARLLEPREVEDALVKLLGIGIFTVESLPTARFVTREAIHQPDIPQSVAVLVSPDQRAAGATRAAVEALIHNEGELRISGISAD